MRYVGARYPVQIWSNPTNPSSAEWVSGYSYEPLTVVTRLNNSYTSRKPVPATVGAPEDNPEYWVISGNYNAQVEEYRQEVQGYIEQTGTNTSDIADIKEDIEDIETTISQTKRIILFADSYGTTDSYGVQNFQTRIKNKLELDPNYDVQCFALGGIGFAHADSVHGWTAEDYFKQIENDIVNPETITDFYNFVAWNDMQDATATSVVRSAETSFFNYVKSVLPNAKIHTGFIGCNNNETGQSLPIRRLNLINVMQEICGSLGIRYIENSELIMRETRYIRHAWDGTTDWLHPSPDGAQALCDYMYAYIHDNCPINVRYSLALTINNVSSMGVAWLNNEFYQYTINQLAHGLDEVTTTDTKIADINAGDIVNIRVKQKMIAFLNNGDPVYVNIYHGGIYIRTIYGTVTSSQAQYVNIPPLQFNTTCS